VIGVVIGVGLIVGAVLYIKFKGMPFKKENQTMLSNEASFVNSEPLNLSENYHFDLYISDCSEN
jgi:hypothetical protein